MFPNQFTTTTSYCEATTLNEFKLQEHVLLSIWLCSNLFSMNNTWNENSVTFHYKVFKIKLCRNAFDISNLLFNGMKQNHLINVFTMTQLDVLMWWVGSIFIMILFLFTIYSKTLSVLFSLVEFLIIWYYNKIQQSTTFFLYQKWIKIVCVNHFFEFFLLNYAVHYT